MAMALCVQEHILKQIDNNILCLLIDDVQDKINKGTDVFGSIVCRQF